MARGRLLVLLLVFLGTLSSMLRAQSPPLDPWRDFPIYDQTFLYRIREGAAAKDAARMRREGAPQERLAALVRANHLDEALAVARTAMSADDATVAAVLKALLDNLTPFRSDPAMLNAARQAYEPARARLAGLPREQAAQLAWTLALLDQNSSGRGSQGWSDRLQAFVREYDGTEPSLLAQVDVITANLSDFQRVLADLDAFAAAHPASQAGAKALWEEAFQLSVNGGMAPRVAPGADPTDRLLKVAHLVEELESGKYPAGEWVSRAPEPMIGFFVASSGPSKPNYADGSVDRCIDAYMAFVRKHLQMAGGLVSPGNSIGYVIAQKLGDLYQLKGDRVGGIDRSLTELESTAANPQPVRLLRGILYAQRASAAKDDARPALVERARSTLAEVAAANTGEVSRLALATAAEFEFFLGNDAPALPLFRRYVAAYPTSPWAWVAALRVGECLEHGGEWQAAADAYASAVTAYHAEPLASVLGDAAAARAYGALGRFDEALAAGSAALGAWDDDYGTEYSIELQPLPATTPGLAPPVERMHVNRDALRRRVDQLRLDLRQPEGAALARARWLIEQQRFTDAVGALTPIASKSAGASDARALLHRAQLEIALDLAANEGPHYDKAAAMRSLDALAGEPFDTAVAVAAVARSALLATDGHRADADVLMSATLDQWVGAGNARAIEPAAGNLDADVVAIRRVVFRPLGDLPVYSGMRLNAFSFPASLPSFLVVNPTVLVKTADDRVEKRTVYQRFPGLEHVLQLDDDALGLLGRLPPTLGGTRRRVPTQVMETPNQPVGTSMDILAFWNRYFPARPGHWGGWVLETYPTVTRIEFTDAARTKATAAVTIGYSGATVVLEKVSGEWHAVRLTNIWIT